MNSTRRRLRVCGKSTLFSILIGQEAATTRKVLFKGREVTAPGTERGIVYQRHSLYPIVRWWTTSR